MGGRTPVLTAGNPAFASSPTASARREDWYYRRVMFSAICFSGAAPPRPLGALAAPAIHADRVGAVGLDPEPRLDTTPIIVLLFRTILIGLVLMLVFGLFEQWPRRLPRWLARWVLQVVGVAIAVPLVRRWRSIWLSHGRGQPPF